MAKAIEDEKVWITLEHTINLGNYESTKIVVGLSQDRDEGDPYEQLEEMSGYLRELLLSESRKLKKVLKHKVRSE